MHAAATIERPSPAPALQDDPLAVTFRSTYSLWKDWAINSPRLGEPLGYTSAPILLRGKCGESSEFAASVLHLVHGVPRANLVLHQLKNVFERVGGSGTIGHVFLYVRDAHSLFPGAEPFDAFFDPTSAQFQGSREAKDHHPYGGLYQNLVRHGGPEGRALVRDLFFKGYVRIAPGSAGNERLSILLSSYHPYDSNNPPPRLNVDQVQLHAASSPRDLDSHFRDAPSLGFLAARASERMRGMRAFAEDPLRYLTLPPHRLAERPRD